AEGHRREGQRRAPAPRRRRRAAPAADTRVAARAGEHPGQRRRRSLRPPERRVRPGRVGPTGRRHRVGADLPGIERRRARARDGVPRARLAERRALAPVHAPGRGVGGRAVVSAARDPVPDRAGRSAIRGDAAGPHAVSHRAGVDSRRRRAGVPDPRRQVIASADVVVVGSGAFGASAAYHLVRRGLRVAVLERAALASQTSPRAAGLTSQVRATPAFTTLARRAVTKRAAFSDETGQPLRFTQSGALKIARTERDAEQLALEVTRGVAAGIPIDFVSVAEARRRLPILGERGIVAITWSPTDCNVEPSELPLGYCRAAEKLGAVLLPHTPATGFEIGPGGVEGVRTPHGTIATRVVVDAAGAWSRIVAASLGTALPVVPTRHQLLITEPIPGVGPEFPIARVIDANVYVRHERGGLMLGGYEPDPVQVDAPGDFDLADLTLDIDVLWRLARSVHEQFPIFSDPSIRIAEHRGGLPTLTTDDRYLVGPLTGVRGAWVMSGCCVGGLSVSPALGEAMAEWILDGAPALDLSDISTARFAGHDVDETDLREHCRRAYATHYRA